VSSAKHLLLALGLAAPGCGSNEPETGPRPDVVLVTLDTTRADHLGCYGYERDTSPRLDALAAEGVVHEQAYSTSSWTLPAHASLFTGKFSASHGAQYDAQGPLRLTSGISGTPAWNDYRARGLSPGEVTLAGTLSAAGYATGAVIAGPWMKRVFGLDAGFEHYDDDDVHSVSGRLAVEVTDAALAWVDAVDPGRPLCLFLNYYDPHYPFEAPAPHTFRYLPPERHHSEALSKRPNFVDLYDGELHYTDAQLGRLFDGLRERGRYDGALIVVTADHGELFGEHGLWGHGQALTQEELHVPLVVRYPGGERAGTRSGAPIQLLDVPALVLDRLGLELPDTTQGGRPHPVVAEVYPLEKFVRTGDWRVLVAWPHKYVWNSRLPEALFDLSEPDGEAHNRAQVEPELTARLRAQLESYLASLPPPPPAGPEATIEEDLSEALHNLGYMDGAEEE
jgi:arylsulfatase A-like enzyme